MTRQTSFQLTPATEAQLDALKAQGYGTTTDIIRIAIDRMAREEGYPRNDNRIKRANDIDPNRPGGWIADMSVGAINPDCWFRFSTKAQAREFVALVDSGMSTREAAYEVSHS